MAKNRKIRNPATYISLWEIETDHVLRCASLAAQGLLFRLLAYASRQERAGFVAEALLPDIAARPSVEIEPLLSELLRCDLLRRGRSGLVFNPTMVRKDIAFHLGSAGASVLHADGEISWSRVRIAVLARDGRVCRYCGAPDASEADHVLARSRGGTDHPSNLVAACRICNSSKGARPLEEWLS